MKASPYTPLPFSPSRVCDVDARSLQSGEHGLDLQDLVLLPSWLLDPAPLQKVLRFLWLWKKT